VKLRHVVGALLLALFFGASLAPAANAQYPPTQGNGRVTKSTVAPGGCVTFSGDGFAPSTTVTVTDNGKTVTTVTTSLTGTFSVEVCPEVLGVHNIRGTGKNPVGGTRVVVAQVTVTRSGLPRTGSNTTIPAIGIGAALVLLGAGIVFAFRRRRHPALVLSA
jgi:LPXTG-motif cell wall-anchored protein